MNTIYAKYIKPTVKYWLGYILNDAFRDINKYKDSL